MAEGSAVEVIASCEAWIVIDSLAVAVAAGELLSCAATVKLAMPALVGVPEIRPVLDMLRPAGRLPDATDHVYPGVPPVALRDVLYDVPTRPTARLVEVMLNLVPLTLEVNVAL